jgi:hypothetical protein
MCDHTHTKIYEEREREYDYTNGSVCGAVGKWEKKREW